MWSSEPCEGLVARSARSTFTPQLFEDPEYWSSPWNQTHDPPALKSRALLTELLLLQFSLA